MKYAPVGTVVYNAYWREHYTVMSHNGDGSVTVQWHGDAQVGNPSPPRRTTHFTRMEPRDRIVQMRVCIECGLPLPPDSPEWRITCSIACLVPGLERQDAYDRAVGR